jgi:hypothetical protein
LEGEETSSMAPAARKLADVAGYALKQIKETAITKP